VLFRSRNTGSGKDRRIFDEDIANFRETWPLSGMYSVVFAESFANPYSNLTTKYPSYRGVTADDGTVVIADMYRALTGQSNQLHIQTYLRDETVLTNFAQHMFTRVRMAPIKTEFTDVYGVTLDRTIGFPILVHRVRALGYEGANDRAVNLNHLKRNFSAANADNAGYAFGRGRYRE